jgi:hypothetical protein
MERAIEGDPAPDREGGREFKSGAMAAVLYRVGQADGVPEADGDSGATFFLERQK